MSEHKPGPEFDALIAEKVMGWPVVVAESPEWRQQLSSRGIQCVRFISDPAEVRKYDGGKFVKNWRPSTDIAAAWEVWEELVKRGRQLFQRYVLGEYNDLWYVWEQGWHEGTNIESISWAPTAPMAICLAALKADEKAKGE